MPSAPSIGLSPPEPLPSRPHPAVLIVVALAAVLVLAVVLGLWNLRRDTIAIQTRSLSSLTNAAADDLERGLQGALLALQATRDDLREERLRPGQAEAAAQLHRRVAILTMVRKLWVIDTNGRVIAASGSTTMPEAASFRPALDHLAGDAAALSEPFSDLASHEVSVAMAMRFVRPDGEAGGWVVVEFPAASLMGAFRAADLAPDARMAVYRSDGLSLAGSLTQHAARTDVPAIDLASLADAAPVQALADGTERLVQQRSVAALGVRLVMTRDLQSSLMRWHTMAKTAALGVPAVLLVVSVLLWRMLRAEGLRGQAQQHLRDEREHAALGALAGGVAHDFNNILAAVVGYSEMAHQAAAEGSAQARHLDQVLKAAQRGQAVIERILAFSRGGLRPARVFAAQPVVEQVLGLLAGSTDTQVHVERALCAEPLYLRGDATALFEAVMNLGTNALQAMPEGGTLRVSVQPCVFEAEHWASHSSLAAGAYVRIEISDTGHGVAPEVMERLFEPFFTTRGQAGTGLGLAIVHGVAAEFGGDVDVSSTPGQGSSFALLLPRVAAAEAPAIEAPSDTVAPDGQGQCVLVVDDEPALMTLAEELLALRGYEPVGFTDPLKALAALEADPQRFDLLITDEVMPTLAGTELARRAHAVRADLPVLMLSGYGGPALTQRAREAGIARVLAKPVRNEEFAQAIAEALQQAATAPS